MNRASSATGWVRNPVMKSSELDPTQASSYELGWTYNPITGCLNHINGLCKGGGFPCYAYKLANGRLKQRYLANKHTATDRYDADSYPFYPRFWEEKLSQPIGYATTEQVDGILAAKPPKRKGIFVCDMSDLFGIGIPEEWTRKVLRVIKHTSYNRYYLLTKQPQNLIKFSPFPENCWVGVTATDYWKYVDACNYLSQVKANVKFLSLEPLLSWDENPQHFFKSSGISWLIIGAQTNPYKPPEISWVREIVEAADKAGVKIFLKNNLRPLLIPEDCRKPNYLTEDMFWASEKAQLRQEMPINSR